MADTKTVTSLKKRAVDRIRDALQDYDNAPGSNKDTDEYYWDKARIAERVVVEIFTVWERYVEDRLIAALKKHPRHFLVQNKAERLKRIPVGLCGFIVRGGRRYFDVPNLDGLVGLANALLSESKNPFRALKGKYEYIDLLAAARNRIVHDSSFSWERYSKCVRAVYNIRKVPEPIEFLHAKNRRGQNPGRGKARLYGIAQKVIEAIQTT